MTTLQGIGHVRCLQLNNLNRRQWICTVIKLNKCQMRGLRTVSSFVMVAILVVLYTLKLCLSEGLPKMVLDTSTSTKRHNSHQ